MKHIKSGALLLILAIGVVSACAQTYKSMVLYEVSGPVESIKYDKNNPFEKLLDTVKFGKDGRPAKDIMTYDTYGYPIGFGTKYGKRVNSAYITYDNERRPAKVTLWGNTDAAGALQDSITTSFIEIRYSENGVKSLTLTSEDDNVKEYIFSDKTLDDHGNWTKRRVTVVTKRGQNAEPTEEYEETRQIKYRK